MDASKVRQIVREEIQRSMGSSGTQISGGLGSAVQRELQRSNNASRFGVNNIPFHTHDGVNSPKVKEDNIIPSVSVVGSIRMATEGAIYTLGLNSNFTPQNIQVYGAIRGTFDGSSVRAITVGSAQLTPTFYFQPGTGLSVVTGNKEYPFPTTQPDGTIRPVPAQSSAYLLSSRGSLSDTYALTSENHLVSVSGFPTENDIYARATVIGYTKEAIQVYIPYLSTGWDINLTYIIT